MSDDFATVLYRKRFFQFLVCIFFSFTIGSCLEEYEVNTTSGDVRPLTTPVSTNYLVIDTIETTDVKIEENNVRVFFSMWNNDLRYFEFDINNDKVADIAFSCNLTRGPIGMYSYGGSSICALNKNTEIDIKRTKYALANYSFTFLNYSQRPVTIHNRENYVHGKDYPADLKVDTITATNPKIHSLGDTLDQSGTWSSGAFALVYDKIQQDYWMESIHTGIWRGVDRKFIGLRYTEGRRRYYGWIELKSSQSDNAYEIRLYRNTLKVK